MADISTLYPLILPEVPNLPLPTVQAKVVQAARELCRRGLVWSEELPGISSVADTDEYALTAPAQSEIIVAYRARRDSTWLSPVNENDPIYKAGNTFTVSTFKTMTVTPVPKDTNSIYYVDCFLRPLIGATTLPDLLVDQYADVIADGTKWLCNVLPGGDPNLGAYYKQMFDRAVGDARKMSFSGNTGGQQQVNLSGVFF